MTSPATVPLAGSYRSPLPEVTPAGGVDEGAPLELTVILRRETTLPSGADGVPVRLTLSELRERHGAAPADVELVTRVLTGLNPALRVVASDPGARRLTLAGPTLALARAFGTQLSLATAPGPFGEPVTFRYRTGDLEVPAELDGVIVAVLGLDTRPQASAHYRRLTPEQATVSYTPPQVAAIYDFPSGTGAGQTVGIIELGGGYSETDLNNYFGSLGLATPSVTSVGVDGATNVPDQDPNGPTARFCSTSRS